MVNGHPIGGYNLKSARHGWRLWALAAPSPGLSTTPVLWRERVLGAADVSIQAAASVTVVPAEANTASVTR